MTMDPKYENGWRVSLLFKKSNEAIKIATKY